MSINLLNLTNEIAQLKSVLPDLNSKLEDVGFDKVAESFNRG